MSLKVIILEVHGRQILDSRGNPTVEVEVTAQREDNGIKYTGRESVPSGASTGRFEAIELRDGVEEYFGLGVRKVVVHINNRIQQELIGMNVLEQVQIDRKLVELDGTDNKGNLGANALLGVSLACARCAANAMNEPLYRYLGGTNAKRWPMPTMNVINGGAHAKNTLDFQEFMIVPVGADSFPQALRMGAEVFHFLRQILQGRRDIAFAMDAAASELYSDEDGMYHFPGEKVMRSGQEMIALYEELIQEYPLISIEDGLDENDWDGWQEMTKRLGSEILLVGDDLFVTNVKRIHCGLDLGVANAVLIKVNQIGTLTEAMDAIELAQKSGYKAVISHRSGETEDAFIADLAVAVNAGWIKTGAPCRGERTAKYNQLLRIAEEIDLIQI